MYESPLRRRWASGAPAANAWLSIPAAWPAELLAAAGFESLTIDLQHGLIDDPAALQILQAVDQRQCAVLVRLAWNEPAAIMRALDRGAAGIIAPLITTPAEVEALVAACRYPPHGMRSYGPVRLGVAHNATSLAEVEAVPVIFPMIETAAALDQLDTIAACSGISGLYVGPADLSLSLGLPLPVDFANPRLRTALEAVVAACSRHGLIAAIYADGGPVQDLAALGFRLITIVNDGSLIQRGGMAALAALR
ncbi:MAG: HpcH/HpaI aldolase family protein [Oscillochloridaceae bacterium umkhey_bin13]